MLLASAKASLAVMSIALQHLSGESTNFKVLHTCFIVAS